jgi:predicted membrane channel-forming protein YqfA (hemolysin III family)
MVNAVTAQYTEAQLLKIAGVSSDAQFIGYRRAEKVTNIMISRWPHKAAVAIIYAGTAALVIGYTWYMLVQAWSHQTGWAITFLVVYVLAAVTVAFSWIYGIKHANESSGAML